MALSQSQAQKNKLILESLSSDFDDLIKRIDTFDTVNPLTAYATDIYKKINKKSGNLPRTFDYNRIKFASDSDFNSTSLLNEEELKQINPYAVPLTKAPLSDNDYTRLHENFRRDGHYQKALWLLADFALGERTEILLDVNRAYATEERTKQELERINANETNLEILHDLAEIDNIVQVTEKMREGLVLSKAFGRMVQVKQYDDEGIPERLISLSPLRLGHPYVDSRTWQLLGVEYKDYDEERNILKAKDILYYTNNDIHITPNSKYYGFSDGETVMSYAEARRYATEIAIPEIIHKYWAPLMILKTFNKSLTKSTEIKNALVPGKSMIINAEIEPIIEKIETGLKDILEFLDHSARDTYRMLDIPLVMSYQESQTYASSKTDINQFTERKIPAIRTNLRNIIEPQWYLPNLQRLLMLRSAGIEGVDPVNLLQRLDGLSANKHKLQFPINQAISSDVVAQNINATAVETQLLRQNSLLLTNFLNLSQRKLNQLLPFKIKLSFKPIVIVGFDEMAEAITKYISSGVLTPDVSLDLIHLSQYRDRIMQEKEEIEVKKFEHQRQQMELDKEFNPQSQQQQPQQNNNFQRSNNNRQQ